MKKLILLLLFFGGMQWSNAQINDTAFIGIVTVNKDYRIDLLAKKMADYNEALAYRVHNVKGYRLLLLSTNDRNQAMQVRSLLMQQYSDQKVYMTFISPYIKLKFGNFIDKAEAERYRKQILEAKIVTGNIYLSPEMIELKPEKQKDPGE